MKRMFIIPLCLVANSLFAAKPELLSMTDEYRSNDHIESQIQAKLNNNGFPSCLSLPNNCHIEGNYKLTTWKGYSWLVLPSKDYVFEAMLLAEDDDKIIQADILKTLLAELGKPVVDNDIYRKGFEPTCHNLAIYSLPNNRQIAKGEQWYWWEVGSSAVVRYYASEGNPSLDIPPGTIISIYLLPKVEDFCNSGK